MKKSLLSIVFSGVAIAAMAQTTILNDVAPIPFNPANLPVNKDGKFMVAPIQRTTPPTGLNKAGNPPYYVYNYAQGIVDWNQDQSRIFSYAATMFPDSFVNVVTKNTDQTFDTLWNYYDFTGDRQNGAGTYAHGLGFVMDPRSPMYEADAPGGDVDYAKLGNYNVYRVDSIHMRYFYDRYTDDSVVDTLIFHFYKITTNMKNRFWSTSGSSNPDTVDFAYIPYNFNRNEGSNYNLQVKMPLNVSDSVTVGVRTLNFAVNQLMNAKQPCAVFVTYKPGTDYAKTAPFDTMGAATFDGTPIAKPINTFYFVMNFDQSRYFEANSGIPNNDKIYQNGLFIPPFIRYNNNAGGWAGITFPGQAIYTQTGTTPANRTPVFPDFSFFVSDVNVGVHELNLEGYGLGNAYPNPANANGTVGVDFQLGKTETVTLTVKNILGQTVRTVISNEVMNNGTHHANVDLSGLESGVYFYTLKAGNYTQTKKFSIAK